MSEERRRLAGILAADVVGYSAMVAGDEPGTLARVRMLRTELIEPLAATHYGRLFKTMGDGFLLEFASAVQALRCAIAIQTALNAQPDSLRLRIGVHQGEVVPEGDDLFGDGVIIAARLEPLAEHGGIVISSRVREDASGKMTLVVDDLGEPALKNVESKIRAYRVRLGALAESVGPGHPLALALPDKPSLVVLPFQNMSGDAEQEYFVDGLVEDITTALSCVRSLFVIARNSAFTYKGRAIDVRQVGRELGVRYVLEGSVRKAGYRVRITGQLIEAATGTHLWADRFDGALEDVFDLQDRVTSSVAGAIEPHLQLAEIKRAQRKATVDLGAYDHFLRGLSLLISAPKTRWAEAGSMFSNALALDSEYAAAYAMAAMCVYHHKMSGVVPPTEAEIAEGVRLARLAAVKGAQDTMALAWAGYALTYLAGDVEGGLRLTERACALNPNSVAAWGCTGWNRLYAGDPEEAILDFERALRLSPRDVEMVAWQAGIARAHFNAARYDEAVTWSERAISNRSDSTAARRTRAAAHAQAGRIEEARRAMAELLALDPRTRLTRRRSSAGPWRRPDDFDRWVEGLRLAGIPD